MRRMNLLLACLMMLLPLWSKDDNRYRNITMNDGLAANAVRNIVQDKNGFIWFGTDNGLCCYDGVKVQHYRIGELGVNQYISALLGSKLLAYVAINGFEHYASFVVDNNFSVYKMPKFSLYVPREALVLKKK